MMNRSAPPAPDARTDALAVAAEAVVREAGALALGFFESGTAKTWRKADASIVTEADLAVDRLLQERLTALDPAAGWLSEEIADTPERLGRERVWVVDPIDGTRAFVDGIPVWVVSVALVERGRPMIGLIFNPTRAEMFVATSGGGSRLNGARLEAPAPVAAAAATLVGPRGVIDSIADLGFTRGEAIYALAYRLVAVAAGRCDAALASARARDWDVAAADLILAESGAELRDIDGRTLDYNQPAPVHRPLVAAREPLNGALRAALGRAATAGAPPNWI
jgi:myo-inositol-1(or 4)-monophosphatase